MTSPFLDAFFDPPRPGDDLAQEIQDFSTRTGLPDVLGLAGITGILRPAPNTLTRTTHGYTLRTRGGRIIGGLQSVTPTQARDVEVKRVVDRRAHGTPQAIIPQALTTHIVRVARLALYRASLVQAFGADEIVMLTDQFIGLRFRDHWAGAGGVILGIPRVYDYSEAYFTDLGEERSSTNDRIVREDATLVWRTLTKVQ